MAGARQAAGARAGYVAHPYTIGDAEQRLAEVSGDGAFAKEFFASYIQGRQAPDFAALLEPAGLALQKLHPGQAWWGSLRLEARAGLTLVEAPLSNTPAYAAGLDRDDQLRTLDGVKLTFPDDVASVLRKRKPGDTIEVEYSRQDRHAEKGEGGAHRGSSVLARHCRVDRPGSIGGAGRVSHRLARTERVAMAVPWLRVINAVLGITDVVQLVKGRGATDERREVAVAPTASGLGGLEARLAGVVVAALKEAFESRSSASRTRATAD